MQQIVFIGEGAPTVVYHRSVMSIECPVNEV